jgi:hypothetical protein
MPTPLRNKLCVAIALIAFLGSTPARAIIVTLKADAPDALIVEQAPTTVKVVVKAQGAPPETFELRQTYINRYGEEKAGDTVPVPLEKEWTYTATVPVEFYGPTTYRATLVRVGQTKAVSTTEQILLKPVPVPKLEAKALLASPIGVNTHNKAHWKTLAALGVHWARDYSWGWLGHGESIPVAGNKTDFAAVNREAEEAGLIILPILQQAFRTQDHKFFLTDEKMISKAYEKFSKAFPKMRYWELDNEADLEHRDLTSADYLKWRETYLAYIKSAEAGLKAAGNDAVVALNGEAGIYPDRAQFWLKEAGDHFAVINYHYYTGVIAPELAEKDINTGSEDRPQSVTFVDLWREINQVAHAAGKQAWLTEIGWSARRGPFVGDRLQSAYLGRIYLLAPWTGTDKTFWFWDRDLEGNGRFASTGLIDEKTGALPAGAAMAAVSKFTAQATYAGNVDLGEDRWCILFQRPEGGWLAGAWAVQKEYSLPEPLEKAAEAFDLYGNKLRDRRLTAEPAYFYLADLPASWKAQRNVQWLSSSTINLYQGSGTTVEIGAARGTKVTWKGLPTGAEGLGWTATAKGQQAGLKVSPTLAIGLYPFTVVAEGGGWSKEFRLRLVVRPAVDVQAVPYTAGKESALELNAFIPEALEATLKPTVGTVQPEKVALKEGRGGTATFQAPVETEGPVQLTATLSNGAVQSYWIRPRQLKVPKAGDIILDGNLQDWPKGGELPPEALKVIGQDSDFKPRLRVTWAADGLYVAAQIPVGEGFTPAATPEDFWEWTGLELWVNAADLKADPSTVRTHQFWFTPTKDTPTGPWRVYAGEWEKPSEEGKKFTIKDDQRVKSGMLYQNGVVTIEALLPEKALGALPSGGQVWAMKLNAKISRALSPKTVAHWPEIKKVDGWAGWGELTFGD